MFFYLSLSYICVGSIELLRICARALMLCIIATVRGAYMALEQPASSQMKHFPDFVHTAKRIQNLLGMWKEQYLPGAHSSNIIYPVPLGSLCS